MGLQHGDIEPWDLHKSNDFVFMVGSRVLFCSPHTDTTGSWPTLFSPVLPGQFLLPTALTLRCRYQVCQAPWQVPHKHAEDNEVMTPPFCYRAFPLESRVPLSFVVTSSGAMPRRFLYLTSLDSPTSSCLLWLRKLGSPLCASPLLHPPLHSQSRCWSCFHNSSSSLLSISQILPADTIERLSPHSCRC